jgi:peptide/nickel transport system substrate-binding protein
VTFVHTLGTGPFQLKLWEENVKLVLRKTLYFMKEKGNALPYLEAVAITFYRISKVVLQFIQGKLDFTSGLDPSYKDDILTQTGEQPKYKDEVNLITGPYLNTEYLGFMDGDNKAVRLTHSSSDELRFRPPKMITYLR